MLCDQMFSRCVQSYFQQQKDIKNKFFCWLVPRSRHYKEWDMQSFSGIHLLCVGITIIVNIGSLSSIKNWSVFMKKTIPTTFFGIKTAGITSGVTVGRLSMETFQVTKVLLDRQARVFALLTSISYCISPLFQEGLEIPC